MALVGKLSGLLCPFPHFAILGWKELAMASGLALSFLEPASLVKVWSTTSLGGARPALGVVLEGWSACHGLLIFGPTVDFLGEGSTPAQLLPFHVVGFRDGRSAVNPPGPLEVAP